MFNFRAAALITVFAVLAGGCAATGTGGESSRGLVGAWVASASRPGGQGVVLLTFNSDGTFFRSGDTHPILSVAHGVWRKVGERDYDGSYVALRFDENRKLIGSQRTRIRVTLGPGEDQFTGLAKVSVRDLNDTEERASETRLAGKRIAVEAF